MLDGGEAITRDMGLEYDSSMMADDDCYELLLDGEPTGVVELPVEWMTSIISASSTRWRGYVALILSFFLMILVANWIGLLPGVGVPRAWQQDVDWVLHARNRLLSPAEVVWGVTAAIAAARVYRWRAGIGWTQ